MSLKSLVTPKANVPYCTHIKVNGLRCGSPAMAGKSFCYFHQRLIRGVRTPPKSRIHPIAILEDPSAIQSSIMEIVNALIRNHIDIKRARLILRALGIAARNVPKTNFNHPWHWELALDVPKYSAAPPGPKALILKQAEALAHVNEPQNNEEEPIDYFANVQVPSAASARGKKGSNSVQ